MGAISVRGLVVLNADERPGVCCCRASTPRARPAAAAPRCRLSVGLALVAARRGGRAWAGHGPIDYDHYIDIYILGT